MPVLIAILYFLCLYGVYWIISKTYKDPRTPEEQHQANLKAAKDSEDGVDEGFYE